MDRTVRRAQLSGDIRRINRELAKVVDALVEVQDREFASKLTDLELQLAHTAQDLLEKCYEPLPGLALRDRSDGWSQQGLPF